MNVINCDMRKYTGLTQPESDCHLKMSSIFHCLGLYNDPSDINFVHVHQNAIRNASTLLPSWACPGPPIEGSQGRPRGCLMVPCRPPCESICLYGKVSRRKQEISGPPGLTSPQRHSWISWGGTSRIGGDLRISFKPMISIRWLEF